MTYYVSSGTLNSTNSFTFWPSTPVGIATNMYTDVTSYWHIKPQSLLPVRVEFWYESERLRSS